MVLVSPPSSIAPSNDSSSSSCCWRIFPPPAAHPRRTKKKQKKQRQQRQPKKDSSNDDYGNDQQQEPQETNLVQKQKQSELWRQKQQQYQYTYPYRVGDDVIMMTPQQQSSHRKDEGIEGAPKKKKQKLSKADDRQQLDSEAVELSENINSKTNSNKSSTNCFVPVPGKVVKIYFDENEVRGSLVHVVRKSCCDTNATTAAAATTIFSPKEQRKRLCPDLSPRVATPLPLPLPLLLPLSKPSISVVLVEETLPFRQVVRFQLHNHRPTKDRVLEIGCSTGELSKLVWKNHSETVPPPLDGDAFRGKAAARGPSWIGMDHSQEMIDRCETQLRQHQQDSFIASDSTAAAAAAAPNYATKVVKVDALEEPKRAFQEATTPTELFGPGPTVVLIDIGGNRECGPVVKTLAWVLEAFGGNESHSGLRMVIVKSRALVRQLLSDCGSQSESKINNHDLNSSSSSISSSIHNKYAIPGLDAPSGLVSNGAEWFTATHQNLLLANKNRFEQRFKHPLKAPRVFSPTDATNSICICRYHNYHKDGCKLYNNRFATTTTTTTTFGTTTQNKYCLLDHDHCHACLQKGHVAKNCPLLGRQSCY